MKQAIHGIDAQIAHGDTFHSDRHPNPQSRGQTRTWGRLPEKHEMTSLNARERTENARVHLNVLANGAMSSSQSGEGEIRLGLIEADLGDCMVALPGQLFYSTQIPVCLWFVARTKKNGRFRDRRGALFIDARKLGTMADRVHRELLDADVARIAGTYHAWRGDNDAGEYADVPGFCKRATLEDIRKHGHVLTPGRYVGAEAAEDDGEPFVEKRKRLTATLREQQAEAARLDAPIAANLKELGYGA